MTQSPLESIFRYCAHRLCFPFLYAWLYPPRWLVLCSVVCAMCNQILLWLCMARHCQPSHSSWMREWLITHHMMPTPMKISRVSSPRNELLGVMDAQIESRVLSRSPSDLYLCRIQHTISRCRSTRSLDHIPRLGLSIMTYGHASLSLSWRWSCSTCKRTEPVCSAHVLQVKWPFLQRVVSDPVPFPN